MRDDVAAGSVCLEPAALYERHERRLRCSLARRIEAPQALIEDACAFAWVQLIEHPPRECDERIFGWLRTVALHEALRLLGLAAREQAEERLGCGGSWAGGRQHLVPGGRADPELAFEAAQGLELVAGLRERERRYLTLRLAGLSYAEIAARCGVTYTNVNKHLSRARARLRALAQSGEGPQARQVAGPQRAAGPSAEEEDTMTLGPCRTEGCQRPRRGVVRGAVEPLCEQCYQAARERVGAALAAEEEQGGRRYRRFSLAEPGREPEKAPERVAPVARAGARSPVAPEGRPPEKRRRGPGRPRAISDELLGEARRLYAEEGHPMREVADRLLSQTAYANARSAEMALHRLFRLQGWALRGRGRSVRRPSEPAQAPRADEPPALAA